MAWLENNRRPQYENFVGLCMTDATKEHCGSTCETNLTHDNCQLSMKSDVEKAGVETPYRNPSDTDSSADLGLELGSPNVEVIVDNSEKECRICSINSETNSRELGIPIVLGCSCNGDLAFAHKKCAEKWFKIKGNKNCEICGSTAKSLVGFGGTDSTENSIKSDNNVATTSETPSHFHGYWLISCILSGLLLVLLLCWLLRG